MDTRLQIKIKKIKSTIALVFLERRNELKEKLRLRFIERAKIKHGEKNIALICPEHGEFQQTPHSHLNSLSGDATPKEYKQYLF